MPKFRNRKTVLANGLTFDSRKEARRWQELRILEKAGEISKLERQVKFQLLPKQAGERAVHYICDFRYEQDGKTVVEDVKSPYTRKLPLYILKRKMMKLFHQIDIQEV